MKESSSPQLNNPKIVRAWYMYDWANSVYALVISSILFPVYYKAVTTVDGRDMVVFLGFEVQNSVLYTYVLSFSFLLVAADPAALLMIATLCLFHDNRFSKDRPTVAYCKYWKEGI